MSEPENHTLRLLREIREGVRSTDAKVDRLQDSIDGLTQALAGEMAANRYTAGGVERRLTDVERRLLALEQADE